MSLCAVLLLLPSPARNCLPVKKIPLLLPSLAEVAFRAMFLFQKKHVFIIPLLPDLCAFPQALALDAKLLSHSTLHPLSPMVHPFPACSLG